MDENEIVRSIGRLEGKMDMLIDLHTKDSERLDAVEKKVWYASGASIIVGGFLAKLGLPVLHY